MQKKDAITIKDIAKALNLSVATVSRSLKDSYQISEQTKKKVRAYAEANHYMPNLMAQSRKTRSIGLMICSIPNNFLAEVISGIESAANSKNYHVIITQSHESFEREMQNLDFLTSRAVDGFLVSIATETQNFSHFEEILSQNLPIVFFDRIPDIDNIHQVVSDNHEGAYNATKHLLQNGFTKIGHITSSVNLSITKERLEGYYKALEEFNIPLNEMYIKYCHHGGMLLEEVEKAISELLAAQIPVDAILTASDRITTATLKSLQERGLKIPDDIGIVGFTNFSFPELFNPPLTTVNQSAFEMGKTAAELLITQIESKRPLKAFEKIILPAVLTVRKTSMKAKQNTVSS